MTKPLVNAHKIRKLIEQAQELAKVLEQNKTRDALLVELNRSLGAAKNLVALLGDAKSAYRLSRK